MLNIASKQFIQSQVFYDLPLLKETYKCSSVQIRCKKKVLLEDSLSFFSLEEKAVSPHCRSSDGHWCEGPGAQTYIIGNFQACLLSVVSPLLGPLSITE